MSSSVNIINILQSIGNQIVQLQTAQQLMTSSNSEQLDTETARITSEINTLLSQFSELNVKLRNSAKSKELAEKIILLPNTRKQIQKYETFLQSKSVHGIITGLTQIGKSNAVKEMIEVCLRHNMPLIVSSDNKTDQQEQLFNRIKNDLSGTDDIALIQVSDRNFSSKVKNNIVKNKPFIIFCLNNHFQIEKIIDLLGSCATRNNDAIKNIHKFMILHDEGDIIQKDADIVNIHNQQAQSHSKWIELTQMFNQTFGHIDLKRVFVTATPENCCALYDIECAHIIQLETPITYRGWEHIIYNELNNDLDIKTILDTEISRIKTDTTNQSGEVILYCIERNTDASENSHIEVLDTLSQSFPNTTIHTYNSKGMAVHTSNKKLLGMLEKGIKIKTKKTKTVKHEKGFLCVGKQISIKKFYSMCKEAEEKVVITIGKDLINRGISYVSEDKEFPLAATTMIYKPGESMHVIGDVQTIGRITGTARPDLSRRLYAHKKVINDYKHYNKNQSLFMKAISENGGQVTSDLWKQYEFKHRLQKSLDRKVLKLKPIFEKPPQYNDKDRMRHLINQWLANKSIISNCLIFVRDKVRITESQMKDFIKNCGSENVEKYYGELIRKDHGHNLVFTRTNDVTMLTNNALKYLEHVEKQKLEANS